MTPFLPSDTHITRRVMIASLGAFIMGSFMGERAARGDEVKSRRLRLAGELKRHSETVAEVAFSPDGQALATCSYDKTIRLSNVRTGQQRALLETPSEVVAVAFSPDGSQIASAGLDRTVRTFEVATGRKVIEFRAEVARIEGLAYLPDGHTLAVLPSYHPHVPLFDARTGIASSMLSIKGGLILAFIGSTGRYMAIGGGSATVTVWDLQEKRIYDSFTALPKDVERPLDYTVMSISFSEDGTRLAVACGVKFPSIVTVWQLNPSKLLRSVLPDKKRLETARVLSRAMNGLPVAYGVAVSPDGSRLAVAYDQGVLLWDVARQRFVGEWLSGDGVFDETEDTPSSIRFSPDGKLIAAGLFDGRTLLFSLHE